MIGFLLHLKSARFDITPVPVQGTSINILFEIGNESHEASFLEIVTDLISNLLMMLNIFCI